MDGNVENKKTELLEVLKNSPEVKRFEKARAAIKGRADARERIDAFRSSVYSLHNGPETVDMLDKMNGLFALREELHQDPQIAEYLDSELDVCRMLQKICMEVMNVTDLEIEAFEWIISS